MARHPKQNEYERNAANRHALRIQAAMFGWTKLDPLAAFLTPDGDIVVIDKELNRYSAAADAEQLTAPVAPQAAIVAPIDFPAEELGPRWAKGHLKLGNALLGLDLATEDRAAAIVKLETVTASLLRAVEVLRAANGPDWREQIGISDE